MNQAQTIWVIDDDTAILEAMQAILEEEGYTVIAISDPLDIGTNVRIKDMPHLIFLDILMSGADGREVVHYLRSRSSVKHVPIVMVSAHMRIQEIVVECGADDFLKKPFGIDELLAKVHTYIK